MDRIAESHAIFMDAWDAVNRGSPRFESRRGGLMEASWSGYPVFFFNLAITARPPASLPEFADSVQEMSAWAEQRQVPWMLAVCDQTMGSLLPETASCLDQLGFMPMMPLTGMESDELTAPSREKPAATWLTETDASIGGKVMRLNEAAYQMPIAEPESLALERGGWWSSPERMVTLLAREEKPASCAAVLGVRGLRYVAFVATHPEVQRRGYAEAAMRDVLDRSRAAGLEQRTYLHATAAGRPVYERMGYRATAEYTVFGRKEFFPAEH